MRVWHCRPYPKEPRFVHELRRYAFPMLDAWHARQGPLPWSPGELVVFWGGVAARHLPQNRLALQHTAAVNHGAPTTEHLRIGRNPTVSSTVKTTEQTLVAQKDNWGALVRTCPWSARRVEEDYQKTLPWTDLLYHPIPVRPAKTERDSARPMILGDWRNPNKGSTLISRLAALMPEFTFCRMNCPEETVQDLHDRADIYLMLSTSEGGCFSLLDSMARGNVTVATNVGIFGEPQAAEGAGFVFPWEKREDVKFVSEVIKNAWGQRNERHPQDWIRDNCDPETWGIRWKHLAERVLDSCRNQNG